MLLLFFLVAGQVLLRTGSNDIRRDCLFLWLCFRRRYLRLQLLGRGTLFLLGGRFLLSRDTSCVLLLCLLRIRFRFLGSLQSCRFGFRLLASAVLLLLGLCGRLLLGLFFCSCLCCSLALAFLFLLFFLGSSRSSSLLLSFLLGGGCLFCCLFLLAFALSLLFLGRQSCSFLLSSHARGFFLLPSDPLRLFSLPLFLSRLFFFQPSLLQGFLFCLLRFLGRLPLLFRLFRLCLLRLLGGLSLSLLLLPPFLLLLPNLLGLGCSPLGRGLVLLLSSLHLLLGFHGFRFLLLELRGLILRSLLLLLLLRLALGLGFAKHRGDDWPELCDYVGRKAHFLHVALGCGEEEQV